MDKYFPKKGGETGPGTAAKRRRNPPQSDTMARVRLSKSALQQQRTQLRLYKKLLPSLDLKRRQLMMEHKKAQAEYAEAQAAADKLEAAIGAELPMLANTESLPQGAGAPPQQPDHQRQRGRA